MTATNARIGEALHLPRADATQIYDWVRGSPVRTDGSCARRSAPAPGLGAIVFRYLILWFTQLFSGHDDYSATPARRTRSSPAPPTPMSSGWALCSWSWRRRSAA